MVFFPVNIQWALWICRFHDRRLNQPGNWNVHPQLVESMDSKPRDLEDQPYYASMVLRMAPYTYKSMYICYFSSMESCYKYWLFSLNNVSLTSFHINKHKSIIYFLKAEQFSIAPVCHNSFNQFQSMYIEAVYQDSFGHKWQNQIQISLCKMENLLDNITENVMARSRMTGSSVEPSPRIDLYPSLTSTHLCFSLLPGFIISSPTLLTKQCQYVEP